MPEPVPMSDADVEDFKDLLPRRVTVGSPTGYR
jgi:hypothetical protein